MMKKNDGMKEAVSQASLAARKAWLTRKGKLEGNEKQEKKSDGQARDFEIKQVKAGGVKKCRIGKMVGKLRYIARDSKKSIVLGKHDEVREILWGRKNLEEILKNRSCAAYYRECWAKLGVNVRGN